MKKQNKTQADKMPDKINIRLNLTRDDNSKLLAFIAREAKKNQRTWIAQVKFMLEQFADQSETAIER